ncbi:MAG: anthranilate synthase component I family protein [Bacteroidota bacterium]|nr:anthranilate synthase component I family protein [Bacteroidota bacterium]
MNLIADQTVNKNSIPAAGSFSVHVQMKSFLDDTCTPVSLYLRLRDKFPGAVLLESADNAEGKNARSIIAIEPVAEIRVENESVKISVPAFGLNLQRPVAEGTVPGMLNDFLALFRLEGAVPPEAVTGMIGYTTYDAIPYLEELNFRDREENNKIPLLRYALYKYVIVFDHLHHRMHIVEQLFSGEESNTSLLESLVRQLNIPQYRFSSQGPEKANMRDEDFLTLVDHGKAHCKRGDVFQLVLSRRFTQQFSGDEFNVYRALRAINPSPYLFFADFGDYRIFGSSPEAQLVIQNNLAEVYPIAGTFRRTGDGVKDDALEKELLADPKENSEHIMLVDLARNDLSRSTTDVRVEAFREVHRFSHVIHLVSKVSGKIKSGINVFKVLRDTFPAGTLSGAPKFMAIKLIDKYEPTSRSFYGGCIGLVGFDGSMNQAIMIRSFLSKNGELTYQAGAGIVVNSDPEKELQEINNKLEALRSAIRMASTLKN